MEVWKKDLSSTLLRQRRDRASGEVCYVAFGMMLHSQCSKQRVIRLARILL
ncbi:unnamed protein product [Brassica oleracea]